MTDVDADHGILVQALAMAKMEIVERTAQYDMARRELDARNEQIQILQRVNRDLEKVAENSSVRIADLEADNRSLHDDVDKAVEVCKESLVSASEHAIEEMMQLRQQLDAAEERSRDADEARQAQITESDVRINRLDSCVRELQPRIDRFNHEMWRTIQVNIVTRGGPYNNDKFGSPAQSLKIRRFNGDNILDIRLERGLNVVILHPDGSVKAREHFDTWQNHNEDFRCIDFINANFHHHHYMIVTSWDSIQPTWSYNFGRGLSSLMHGFRSDHGYCDHIHNRMPWNFIVQRDGPVIMEALGASESVFRCPCVFQVDDAAPAYNDICVMHV